jgi:hypothetical protein
MRTPEEIENDITAIKERNVRVELDKAWERSWARRITIMILTFIVASIWLVIIDETNVLLKAIVPTFGYLLSTLSIPLVRRVWMKNK